MRNYHRTLMKTLLYFIFILLVTLVAPVNAQTPATKQAESTPTEDVRIIERQNRPISIHKSFGSNQIRDWQVLDDNNMVIEAVGRKKYKATFMTPCNGIRYTYVIALANQGPFELDQFTTVILPDGERCPIKELVPYTAEMEQQDKEQKNELPQRVTPGTVQ